jgi:hypothetical protein
MLVRIALARVYINRLVYTLRQWTQHDKFSGT